MNIDDLISLDKLSVLTAELLDLLAAFGFVQVTVKRDRSKTLYFTVIVATHLDGSDAEWHGTGSNPEQADSFARVSLEVWILNQQIPSP